MCAWSSRASGPEKQAKFRAADYGSQRFIGSLGTGGSPALE